VRDGSTSFSSQPSSAVSGRRPGARRSPTDVGRRNGWCPCTLSVYAVSACWVKSTPVVSSSALTRKPMNRSISLANTQLDLMKF
jgi:hypothetical protein